MSESKPGPIRRLLVGLWNTVNFTRRLVFNLVFLVLLFAFIAVLFSSPGVKPLMADSALVINLGGDLVEQYTAHPVDRVLNQATGQGRLEIQVRDLLRAIEAAKDDDRIWGPKWPGCWAGPSIWRAASAWRSSPVWRWRFWRAAWPAIR